MDEKQLKPCPFCGRPGERWIDESGDSPFPVHGCSHCAEMFYGDESEWNARPIEDMLQAEVNRMREALERYAYHPESVSIAQVALFGRVLTPVEVEEKMKGRE